MRIGKIALARLIGLTRDVQKRQLIPNFNEFIVSRVDLWSPTAEPAPMHGTFDTGRLSTIGAFERSSKLAESLQQLSTLIDGIVRDFGFRWFALIHNVDLVRRSKKALMLTTYPAKWLDELIETRLYLDDPVHMAVSKTTAGLNWNQISDFIDPSPRQIMTLEKGRAHGLREGFTMPMRMTDEPDGMFSVARATECEISGEDALAARLIGTIAFDRGRELLGDQRPNFEPVALSPRQIDCIALVGQGKSDWEAAQILGLSRDTVHEYVEGARRRYGVRRRTQLVLRAVRDGHLNIDAML